MRNSKYLVVLVFLSLTSLIQGTNNDDNVCCGPVNLGQRIANTAAVYNTPAQVQTSGGDDRYWVSTSSSQKLDFPGLFADPFPDPTGLQIIGILRQMVVSLGSIGLQGRSDIVFARVTCTRPSCTQSQIRYGEFFADITPKPAAIFVAFDAVPTQTFITFNAGGDVIAYNSSAVDPKTGCKALVRALDTTRVPADPLTSDAIQNGDLIHTSMITAQDQTASIQVQTTNILITLEDIISKAGGDRDDFVYVYLYFQTLDDLAASNVAYAAFFANHPKPVRTVQGAIAFLRPQQVGAKIGMRVIARTPESRRCPNPLLYVSNPQIFAESSTLATQAVGVGNFIYAGGLHGTKDTFGPESIVADHKTQYIDTLANLEYLASEAGSDRNDLIFIETYANDLLNAYGDAAESIGSFWNWTTSSPPTITLDSGTNRANATFEVAGLFYKNWNNYGILPTPYPWAIFGLLTDQIFGLPIGTVPNNTFCTSSSLVTCPKPGFFFNSYPLSNYGSLGSQGESVSEHN